MKQSTKKIQPSNHEAVPPICPIEDIERAAEAFINRLFVRIVPGDDTSTDDLLLTFYQLKGQSEATIKDFLGWAVTHCYRLTHAAAAAENAYVARLLQQAAKGGAQ
jgi:hypothetical protein